MKAIHLTNSHCLGQMRQFYLARFISPGNRHTSQIVGILAGDYRDSLSFALVDLKKWEVSRVGAGQLTAEDLETFREKGRVTRGWGSVTALSDEELEALRLTWFV